MSEAKPMKLSGKARIVPPPDVDTDMIFHNRHLHITKPSEMAPLMFGNLKGWEDFPKQVKSGDILIVGHNFGCGSSRQQAVDGFIALGVGAIVGESFGAIYKRNAINAGWPLVECPGILAVGISDGDEMTLDLESGEIFHHDNPDKPIATGKPFTEVQRDIYQAGGLLELG